MSGPRRRDSGFTIVELLVVTVLGGLILAALYEVLAVNQRTYTAQSASSQIQQTLRASASVLYAELREISPAQGDIVAMDADALEIRAMRSFGHVCQTPAAATANPTLLVRRIGEWFADGDSVTVFTENDPDSRTDDLWQTGRISSITLTGIACPTGGAEAQSMSVQGIDFDAVANSDSIQNGAPVRAFVHYEYLLGQVDGETYLIRSGPDRTEPLLGPVDPSDGVSFEYLDVSSAATNDPTQVNEILVTVRSTSDATDARGVPVGDSLTVRIYPRN